MYEMMHEQYLNSKIKGLFFRSSNPDLPRKYIYDALCEAKLFKKINRKEGIFVLEKNPGYKVAAHLLMAGVAICCRALPDEIEIRLSQSRLSAARKKHGNLLEGVSDLLEKRAKQARHGYYPLPKYEI